MATFDLSNKVNIVNPSANVDAKYGPWASLSEAKTNVVLAVREKGLTVGIIENEAVVEYWWKTGTSDGHLVLKTGGSSGDGHTHTNKATLDKIGESAGSPTWNGGAWPGGGGAAIDYSTDIEADKASTTKVSAIKTLYDWAAGKFAAIAHSHAYSSLTGLPTLFSGAWEDLTGKPTLFSGSYNDLTNKPTIPTTLSGLSEKSYNSLTDKPTIPTQYTDANVRASALTGVTEATTKANVTATDSQLTAWGKFMKLYTSLKALAFKDTVDYTTDVTNKPTIPAAQVQSDWNASSGMGAILNKPTIPAAQVNSDWNASSGLAQILNKPTIPAAYTHPTGDGNLHVPATGTTNAGKVLTAGATAGSMTWETPASVTPADNSITNAKLEQVATGTIKGRKTAGTGNVEDLTPAEVLVLIGAKASSYNGSYIFKIVNPGSTIQLENATEIHIGTVRGESFTIALPQAEDGIVNESILSFRCGNTVPTFTHPGTSILGKGTVSCDGINMSLLVGTSTKFMSQLNIGTILTISGVNYTITGITSDTLLNVSPSFSAGFSALNFNYNALRVIDGSYPVINVYDSYSFIYRRVPISNDMYEIHFFYTKIKP